jgi:hypothetical protein
MQTHDFELQCPYCFEMIPIGVDPGGGEVQEYIEDCSVCCKSFQVVVEPGDDSEVRVELEAI